MIAKARRCNADRNIGTHLPLNCFETTNDIWCNYNELITGRNQSLSNMRLYHIDRLSENEMSRTERNNDSGSVDRDLNPDRVD